MTLEEVAAELAQVVRLSGIASTSCARTAGCLRSLKGEPVLAAGVDRAELHTRAKESLPVRVHDLRATFVTVSMGDRASAWCGRWSADGQQHRTPQPLIAVSAAASAVVTLRPRSALVGLTQARCPSSSVSQRTPLL